MKFLSKFFAVLFLANIMACTEPAPGGGTSPADPPTDTTTADTPAVPSEPSRPTCKLVGSVLEGNMFWAAGEDRFVVISAEKETEDKDLGESHRILTVYDGKCGQLSRQVLPINFSADYPYYLSEITYNKVSKQVAIRGFDKFYLLDLTNLKLSAPLVPKFLNQRVTEDAQSGTIKRLELWENYLVGFAASMGPFAYDLSDASKPTPVLPLAEFAVVKGEQYNSLFLLKSGNEQNGYQAFAPDYDYDKEVFSLNILFDKPLDFNPVINKSFKNNRFILLKEKTGGTEGKPHAIDMKERKSVELPADVVTQKDTYIIEWLKKQDK
jgi:hypothetical protein